MLLQELETPVTIVDLDVLERNIEEMAAFCRTNGVALRPMVKTHKSPLVAKRQMQAGAVGVLVATLDEAEEMARAGILDITIAYPLVGVGQRERLLRLSARTKLTLSVDSVAAVDTFSAVFGPAAQTGRPPVPVLIIVDSGGRRLGVAPDEAVPLAGHRSGSGLDAGRRGDPSRPRVRLLIAGSSRRSGGARDRRRAGRGGASPQRRFRRGHRSRGLHADGAIRRPDAGITEIRPGNYVFYDAIQVALGAADTSDCALRVAGTVLSRPTPRTAVIDVGSKMLSSDRGAHGRSWSAATDWWWAGRTSWSNECRRNWRSCPSPTAPRWRLGTASKSFRTMPAPRATWWTS